MNSTRNIEAYVDGIGLLGPGLVSWEQARAVLRGEAPYSPGKTVLPSPQLLQPAERRRATTVIKLTLATGLAAVAAADLNPRDLPTVFSSSGGDGPNCHEICTALASGDRLISPTRFHNSVHNVASGYWGIATGSMTPSVVLCAYDGSFAAALLEALSQVMLSRSPVLLLAYDSNYPEPLFSVRPITDSFAVALVLVPKPSPRSLARVCVYPDAIFTDAPAQTLANPDLEALRRTIPAARALPLLSTLARMESTSLALDGLPDQRLAIELSSC